MFSLILFKLFVCLLTILPKHSAVVEWELLRLCEQYNYLSRGNWSQVYGKRWYLYQTSYKDEQRGYTCMRLQYSGVHSLQEKVTYTKYNIRGEYTRFPKHFYLLNSTDGFAATLECRNFGLFYLNVLHILTTVRQPNNVSALKNSIDGVLQDNGLMFKMSTVENDCD